MKRIKSVNGYTIYQATTQRDEDNYNCHVGSYNIYLSTDIRDFGLTNSDPEYDDVDSLTVALNICRDSKFAIACALADELSDSTVQDMDLCLEIERRFDAGESVEYVRDCYDPETGILHAEPSENPSYYTWLDSVRDQYVADCCAEDDDELDDDDLSDDDELDGDLEDVLDAALSAGDHADRLYDQVHSRFEERDYHDPARFEARLAEIAEELGLSQEEVDGFTSDWWLWYEAGDPAEHELLRLEGEWRVDDDVLDDSLRQEIITGVGSEQCPVEPEEDTPAAPKQERRSHASYYVIETCDSDCQWLTCTVNRPADLSDDQYRKLFFRRMAVHVAFSDCNDDSLDEIVFDGERVEYVGWQPGMLIEFRSCETGEIVYSGSFPEWDH